MQGKTAADIADEEITELIEKLEKKQKDRENTKAVRLLILLPNIKHLIQKRLSSELLHCALLHTQTAKHHGCNEFLNSSAGTYYETATFVY